MAILGAQSREDRIFEMARRRLEKETDIVEMIKSRRYVKAALRQLLSSEQRLRLKSTTRYAPIMDKQVDLFFSGKKAKIHPSLKTAGSNISQFQRLPTIKRRSSVHATKLAMQILDSDMTSGFKTSEWEDVMGDHGNDADNHDTVPWR